MFNMFNKSFGILAVLAMLSAGCETMSPLAPSTVVGSAVDFVSPPPPPEPPVPPAFPPLQVGPDGAAIVAGRKVTFKASGGDGGYVWSASGGVPASGSGSSFTTVFYRGGATEYVTVTSGDGQKATCEIGVAHRPKRRVSHAKK